MTRIDCWWTVEDMMETYGVARWTVLEWVRRGDLVAHKFGRSWRFSDAERKKFENSRVYVPKRKNP